MKLNKLVFAGLIFSSCLLSAQTDFRPGYIIKNSDDTIFGNIDYRGDILMNSICKFKDNSNEVFDYSPNDIKAFRFIDSKYFVSRDLNNRKAFLECLIKGKISIYYMRDENGDHYYIDKENQGFTEIPYEEGFKYIDYKRMYYESKQHIGILTYYTQDVPEFIPRIQAMNKPEHQNLIKLAEDYHNVVCKDEQCVTFEKKLPLFKVSIQTIAVMTKYKVYYKYLNEFGAYLIFWAPRTNENIFFKTGLVHMKLSEEGMNLHIYKIPLKIEYMYKAYKLQPEIGAGVHFLIGRLNDYKDLGHTLCLNAGLNFEISNTVSICTGFDCEFTPLSESIFGDYEMKLLSHSISVGLRIDF